MLIIALLGISAIAAGFVFWGQINEKPAHTDSSEPVSTTPDDTAEQVTGRHLFTGTTVIARGVQQAAERADGNLDPQQPFSKLDTLKPEKYDAWSTDLECPVTDARMTFREQVNNLVFNCRTEFVDPIVEHFELINLASNHTGDLGREAFNETQRRLDDAGAQIFGHYDPSVKEDTCEVIALPVRVVQTDDTETPGRLPIAFCAWHYFQRGPQPGELETMLDYVDIMPVFAFTHAGQEYNTEAQPPEVDLARSIIDLGAEFIINNNPHWVQNTEVYNDKLIVYSTGNFIFDQLDEETNRAANLDVTIDIAYDNNVAQWLELGEDCLGRDDSCLEDAKAMGLEKVSIEYTYDVVASLNGYQELARKADPDTQQAVEARMNWQQTLRELGQE